MIKFFRNLPSALIVLYFTSKYQIIAHSGKFKLPIIVKISGRLCSIFLYPQGLFIKPKQSFGHRLTTFFSSLGPIYIKFGQTLSTRPDIVGSDVAESLKYLQDKLPPFDSKIVKATIEEQFDKKMADIFVGFNEKPVAAASIAQVHKAKLTSGKVVAVKILRPNILKKYEKDILLLEFLARLFAKWLKKSRRLKPIEVMAVFRESMKFELDLRNEAAAASKIRDDFKDNEDLHIPEIYWNLTARNILTLEWIDGVSIYDREKIVKSGLNPSEIAAKIAVIFFNQAYGNGFFHADLHPGNILVRADGSIALIDFGIIGILPEKDRLAIAEILYAFLKRDFELVAKVHYDIGYIPKDTNLDLFAQSCRAIAEPIIGLQINEISVGKLLAQLFKVTEDFGMETQPQLLLLQKTIVVVEGIGQTLNPDINMWELAEPWIKKWAAKNLSFEAKILRKLKGIIEDLLKI